MTSLATSEGFEWLRLNIRFPEWNVRVQQLVSFRDGLLSDNQIVLRPYMCSLIGGKFLILALGTNWIS